MRRKPVVALLVIATASLACSVFLGGPEIPTPRPVPTESALQTLTSQLEQAVAESLSSGTLTLHVSQEQLTAFVASKVSTQDPPVMTDPQVVLTGQKMIIYGRARSGMLEANVAVTATFSIDPNGVPEIHISDAQLGPMPMPQALQDAIAAAIDEALTGSIGPAAIGFRLETIDISEGLMTITGRVR